MSSDWGKILLFGVLLYLPIAVGASTVNVEVDVTTTDMQQGFEISAESSDLDVNSAEDAEIPEASKSDSLTYDPLHYHLNFPGRHILSRPMRPDSADVLRASQKHFWRGAGEVFGLNMALWAFDRYVQHGHYAYISWNTIKENFKHGFEWDDDYLGTNMFAHPYNGSQYFNGGRSNGYNFWQSSLFAIGGSAMWELFMENEYPSTNDIIATPIGGTAIGEVLYRASDLIIDERATGFERFGREFAAFVVDPMRGLTRIFSGEAWRTRETSGRVFGVPPISIEVSAGLNMLNVSNYKSTHLVGGALEAKIEYGDPFAMNTRRPYDYFQFLIELNAMKTQPMLNRVEIIGRLLSKELLDGRRGDLSVGLYQHFDYFDSDTVRVRSSSALAWDPCEVPYKFGTPAEVGGGLLGRFIPPGNHWQVEGALHLNGVLMAGILTDYYRNYHRNYNWGSGYGIKAEMKWALANRRFTIDVANQFYQIFTWGNVNNASTEADEPANVMGDASRAWFNHFEAQINYRLWQRLYLSAGVDLYHRQTIYHDHIIQGPYYTVYEPLVISNQIGWHLMLTYKI